MRESENTPILRLNGLGKLQTFNGKANLKSFVPEIDKRSKIEGSDEY